MALTPVKSPKSAPLTGQPSKGSMPPSPPLQKPPAATDQTTIAPVPSTKTAPLTGQPSKGSMPPSPPLQKPPLPTGQQTVNPKQGTEPVENNLRLPLSPPNRSLEGTTGKDSLEAKAGIDRLTGLSGADTFFFSGKPNSSLERAIHITDFSAEEGDDIIINGRALGSVAKATSNVVTVTSGANLQDAFLTSDLFVYDSSSGVLYVNQNGTEAGFGSGGVFAVFDNHANLSSARISIV